MKTIVRVFAMCLLAWSAAAADPAAWPVFQIRLVLDAPSADSEPLSVTHAANPPRQEVIDVQRAVLFDQTAVKSAEVRTDKGYSVIAITFSDDARKRFAELTRQNIGRRLAIIIDGQVCSAPKIRAEIAGGKAEVSGSFTEQQARDLARKIAQKVTK